MSEKKPWKDEEKLRSLYAEKTQSEIAEHFTKNGYEVTPPTISYWMRKFEIQTSHSDYAEEDVQHPHCTNFEECENTTPGPNNSMCDSCLDAARNNTIKKNEA